MAEQVSRLLNPKLKIVRAKEHLDALNRGVLAFSKSKPYRIFTNSDLHRGKYIVFMENDTPSPTLGPLPGVVSFALFDPPSTISLGSSLPAMETAPRRQCVLSYLRERLCSYSRTRQEGNKRNRRKSSRPHEGASAIQQWECL